jgi:hypothetical protein
MKMMQASRRETGQGCKDGKSGSGRDGEGL